MPCDSHGMSHKLARPERFELPTPRFVVCRSQLPRDAAQTGGYGTLECIPLLSMTDGLYIRPPRRAWGPPKPWGGHAFEEDQERRRSAVGQDQGLSTYRQRAIHERAPAGVFPQQAPRLERRNP